MFFADDAIKKRSVTARSILELSCSMSPAIAGNCSVMDLLCKRCIKTAESDLRQRFEIGYEVPKGVYR